MSTIACAYCGKRHPSAAEVQQCFALRLVIEQLGGTVLDHETATLAQVDDIEAQIRRERRKRAAGLTPRGRAPRRRAVSLRPLLAPVESPTTRRPVNVQPVRSAEDVA